MVARSIAAATAFTWAAARAATSAASAATSAVTATFAAAATIATAEPRSLAAAAAEPNVARAIATAAAGGGRGVWLRGRRRRLADRRDADRDPAGRHHVCRRSARRRQGAALVQAPPLALQPECRVLLPAHRGAMRHAPEALLQKGRLFGADTSRGRRRTWRAPPPQAPVADTEGERTACIGVGTLARSGAGSSSGGAHTEERAARARGAARQGEDEEAWGAGDHPCRYRHRPGVAQEGRKRRSLLLILQLHESEHARGGCACG
eukprot:scaffold76847_cov52-Phaeocystis_antarctica.AAC.1